MLPFRKPAIRLLFLSICLTLFALYLFSRLSSPLTSPSSASKYSNAESSILPQVFISVKTTAKFHRSRVDFILQTWFKQAPSQVYFFTDSEDKSIFEISNGHLIQTNCSSSHNRKALCCKMSVELNTFLNSDAHKWFCHFDDDNYVNVARLVELLQFYDHRDDWYLGKPSIRSPLQIMDRKTGSKIGFWFATGGAGFCLSRSLVMKMIPHIRYCLCLIYSSNHSS